MGENLTTEDGTILDPKVLKVVRAIRQVESGGDYNAVGDGGKSKGAYQWHQDYQPWSKVAGETLGNPNAPMNRANQNKAAYLQMKAMKDAGLQPEEIAARWNGAKKDPATGRLTYVNPEYGEKFRKAIQVDINPTGTAIRPTQDVSQQRARLQAQGEPVSVNPERAEPTFGGKIVRGLIKPFVRLGSTIAQPIIKATGGEVETQSKYLGDISGYGMKEGQTTSQRIKDIAGGALELGSFAVGGGGLAAVGKQGLKGLVGQGIKQGIKAGAISGGLQGAGTALQEDKSLTQVGARGLTSAAGGGIFGGALGGASGVLGATAEKLGAKAIAQNRLTGATPQEVLDLVSPKLTPKAMQAATAAGRTTKKGILGKISLEPDAKTIRAAEAVKGIVDPSKTLTENIILTKNALVQEAENLKAQLALVDHPYTFKELQAKLKSIPKPISIKGDKTLNRQFEMVRQAAMDIAKSKGGKVSSLLDARKEFDALISREFPTLYDRSNAPFRNAVLSIREGMNSFINDNLPPGSGFRESLARQSAMYDAIKNMSTKAVDEVGTTSIGRTAAKYPIAKGLIEGAAKTTGAGALLKGVGILP